MIFKFLYNDKYELEVYANSIDTAIRLIKDNRRVVIKNPDQNIQKELEEGLDLSKIKLLHDKIESLEACNVKDNIEFRT